MWGPWICVAALFGQAVWRLLKPALSLVSTYIQLPYIFNYLYSRISRSAYKSNPSLDVKKRPKFNTRVYMLGWDLHLRAAGGDVRTGRVAVAERRGV